MRSINRVHKLFEASKFAIQHLVGAKQSPVERRNAHETPEVIAGLFRDFRTALGLSINQISLRLDTDPGVIVALEMGKFGALPPWPETKRVVTAYTAMADIDARPVLTALHEQICSAAAISVEYAELETRDQPNSYLVVAISVLRWSQAIGRSILGRTWYASKELITHWARAARLMVDQYGPTARDFSLSAYLIAVLPLLGLLIIVMASFGAFEARSSEPLQPGATITTSDNNNTVEIRKSRAFGGPIWIETENPRDFRTDKLQLSRQ